MPACIAIGRTGSEQYHSVGVPAVGAHFYADANGGCYSYADGHRDAHGVTNFDCKACSFADSDSCGNLRFNANPNRDAKSNSYPDPHSHSERDSYACTYSNCHVHSSAYSNSGPKSDANAVPYPLTISGSYSRRASNECIRDYIAAIQHGRYQYSYGAIRYRC